MRAAGLAAANDVLPELPDITVDGFPREVRQQVEEAYDTARAHPSDSEASGKLGMLLDLYHRPDDAARCYQRAQRLRPQAFKWYYYEGVLHAKQKNHAQAATEFRDALRIDLAYLPAKLRLAESLLESGNLDGSARVYAAITKEHPDSAQRCGGKKLKICGGFLRFCRSEDGGYRAAPPDSERLAASRVDFLKLPLPAASPSLPARKRGSAQ